MQQFDETNRPIDEAKRLIAELSHCVENPKTRDLLGEAIDLLDKAKDKISKAETTEIGE